MWCCSPRLTGDEDLRATKAGSPVQQPPPARVSTDAWTVISTHHVTPRDKVVGDRQYQTLDKNFRLSRTPRGDHVKLHADHVKVRVDHVKPRVEHVKSSVDHVKPRVEHVKSSVDHVKPRVDHVKSHAVYVKSVKENMHEKHVGTTPRKYAVHDSGNVIYYKGDGNYKLSAAPQPKPKQHVTVIRSVSNAYNSVSIPRAKLHVTRSYSQREPPTSKPYIVTAQIQHQEKSEQAKPVQNATRTLTEHKTATENGENVCEQKQKLSVDSGVDASSDTGSLTEEQNNALNQLDATLDEYNTGVFDVETPVIVTDVLLDGVFESEEKFDSGLESDEMPSSKTSSLSSNKSLNVNGIITGTTRSTKSTKSTKSKRDRRVTSVSFNLPPDHVDKPYAPLQSHRHKIAPHAPTFTVSYGNGKVCHGDSDHVFVEDKLERRSSGPFKGSFRKIFYGKYSPKDVASGNEQGKLYVSPMLLERVSSFESLNDDKLMRQQHRSESTRGNTNTR